MIWFIVSLMLQGLGAFDKKGIYYVQRPAANSKYAAAGLRGALVTAAGI
jgi:hypothetical protein